MATLKLKNIHLTFSNYQACQDISLKITVYENVCFDLEQKKGQIYVNKSKQHFRKLELSTQNQKRPEQLSGGQQ